jgi:transcriptional regulator with XRE-family HTH domain
MKVVEREDGIANTAGEKLREIRNKRGLSARDVAEQSQNIAQHRHDKEFQVSAPWLTQLETNGLTKPSIFKMFSLACIYGVQYAQLLMLYKLDLHDPAFAHSTIQLNKTHPVDFDPAGGPSSLYLPIHFEAGVNPNRTTLLSRTIEEWGQVPLEYVQYLDRRHRLYGYVGAKDLTLYPLIKPGTFLEIDPEDQKLQSSEGPSDIDRPIYFVDLHTEYACGWCEMSGGNLLVLAHPASPCGSRVYSYPDEAEIVGRVTAIAMRLNGSSSWQLQEPSKDLQRG